jgi:pectin methylesterase-like acyl-CoA thioesterase
MGTLCRRALRPCWLAGVLLASCAARSSQNDAASGGAVGDGNPPGLLASVEARFPAANATDVCIDTPLRLRFGGPVSIGSTGKIQIFKLSDPSTAIDEIDVGASYYTDQIGGRGFHVARPVFVEGNQVSVQLHSRRLAAGETYFVSIDAGMLLDANGAALGGLSDPNGWRFTTRARSPNTGSSVSVALDGSGDFCSVQGAIDFVPEANTTPITIDVKNGTYREIVLAAGKSFFTLRGEDRTSTIIAYENNDNVQLKGGTKVRGLLHVENASHVVIENLTLHNLTAVSGGSGNQAEALRVDSGEHIIVRNADILSLQDTLLLSGHVLLQDCYIEGNVDFVWGRGVGYFERCELKTVGRAGYNVQARNLPSLYGFIFVDSKLTSAPGITGNYLGRIDASVYPASQVAYLGCQLGTHIDPVGWVVTPTDANADSLRLWEHGSRDADGEPLDVSLRHPASRQLTDAEADALRDKVSVLGWDDRAP